MNKLTKGNELKEQWYSNVKANNYASVLKVLFALMTSQTDFLELYLRGA